MYNILTCSASITLADFWCRRNQFHQPATTVAFRIWVTSYRFLKNCKDARLKRMSATIKRNDASFYEDRLSGNILIKTGSVCFEPDPVLLLNCKHDTVYSFRCFCEIVCSKVLTNCIKAKYSRWFWFTWHVMWALLGHKADTPYTELYNRVLLVILDNFAFQRTLIWRYFNNLILLTFVFVSHIILIGGC